MLFGCSDQGVRIFVGRPECEKQLGVTRRKSEDSIKVGFKEMEWEAVDWGHVAQVSDK
jgi:hypothetical protein